MRKTELDNLSTENSLPQIYQHKKLPSLDGMRAICIMLVLFSHISNTYKLQDSTRAFITQIGLLGVQFFFVISGFLITTLLLKERLITGKISLKDFYIRRMLRILPVAFLYLLCMLALNSILSLHIPAKSFLGAAFFLANLKFFHGSWYTAHYWSLSVEEQYYLIFPALLKRFQSSLHYILLFFLFILCFFKESAYLHLSLLPPSNVLDTIAFLLFQSDGVIIGSLMAILVVKNDHFLTAIRRYRKMASLLLPVLIVVIYTNIAVIHSFNSIISSVLISIFIVCNITDNAGITYQFLNNKYLAQLGRLSFSIYIWQQLFTSTDGKLGFMMKPPVNIVCILVASACSYYFFELKFLKIKNRFKKV